jgi:hypothetical protein
MHPVTLLLLAANVLILILAPRTSDGPPDPPCA